VEGALEICHPSASNLHGPWNKRNPAEGAFWTAASAKTQMPFLGVARDSELTADCGDGVGVQAALRLRGSSNTSRLNDLSPTERGAALPPRPEGRGFRAESR
jgi:hypothetical protein